MVRPGEGDIEHADRREFLAMLGITVAAGIGVEPNVPSRSDRRARPGATGSSQGAAITEQTIAEAEKLLALEYTPEERRRLAATMQDQIQAAQGVHRLQLPRELQPGLIFDPRLPGVHYPRQLNSVRLAVKAAGPLPKSDADIAYAPVWAQSQWIRQRKLTSRRLTDIYLERIERLAPGLYCYTTVVPEKARARADAMDRELRTGRSRGPLHGIPYGLKDVIDTAEIRTTWGSALFKERVPAEDATLVKMLHDAGAVLLGKTATAELANGAEWFGGVCRNPWNKDEPAGGSSTGSGSATAAALCSFSIGTDSLGSILNPADRCGVVGLRPTFGRVPVKGGMPLTPSLERIGPLCRGVEDAALVLAAINGPDPTSASSIDMGFAYDGTAGVRGIRVGYSRGWFKDVGFGPGATVPASQAHHRALEALRELGVTLVEVELPALPYRLLINNLYVEAATVFGDLTLTNKDEGLLPNSPWANSWRKARLFSAVDYLELERFRRHVMVEIDKLFGRVDALFGPTYGSFELLMTMNFTGHPGLSMRAGLTESPTRPISGVPADPNGPKHTITQNVAFHGRLFEDGKIIALARALEEKLDVMGRRPPLG